MVRISLHPTSLSLKSVPISPDRYTIPHQPQEMNQSSTGDHVMVVGAASKGIIKREHQHNAVVYKSYYATNPFDKMTPEELTDYEQAVARGEKPPKEEVLADLEQQQQLEGRCFSSRSHHKPTLARNQRGTTMFRHISAVIKLWVSNSASRPSQWKPVTCPKYRSHLHLQVQLELSSRMVS